MVSYGFLNSKTLTLTNTSEAFSRGSAGPSQQVLGTEAGHTKQLLVTSSTGLQPTRDGLHPNSDGLQPSSFFLLRSFKDILKSVIVTAGETIPSETIPKLLVY